MDADLQVLRANCMQWSKTHEAKCGNLAVQAAANVCRQVEEATESERAFNGIAYPLGN